MNPLLEQHLNITRRELFGKTSAGVGMAALASLLGEDPGAQAKMSSVSTAIWG